VKVGEWLRGIFSRESPDDEAAEREEYGVPGRGPGHVETAEFASGEAAETVDDELKAFERPVDPGA
jgi:hypothetical protein